MHRYYHENGYFKDVEVKISMKIFIEGDEYETSYEEKEEHVENLLRCITRDKDIIEVFDIKVLEIYNG